MVWDIGFRRKSLLGSFFTRLRPKPKAKAVVSENTSQRFSECWQAVQSAYADIAGAEGIALRAEHYAPYFGRFGLGVKIDEGCRFYHPDRIFLDDDVRINVRGLFYGSGGIRIGRHTRIGPRFFIHSANHDVSKSELAYFEKGYDYYFTTIGDNCMISANVSVLPGAEVGKGTFVASNAVVTRKRFPADAQLLGMPARTSGRVEKTTAPPCPSPSIGVVVQEDSHDRDVMELLLMQLMLPQVAIIVDGAEVPDSTHTLILVGPDDCRHVLTSAECAHRRWRLTRGTRSVTDVTKIRIQSSAERVPLCEPVARERIVRCAPVPASDQSDLQNSTSLTCYYACKRIAKGAAESSPLAIAQRTVLSEVSRFLDRSWPWLEEDPQILAMRQQIEIPPAPPVSLPELRERAQAAFAVAGHSVEFDVHTRWGELQDDGHATTQTLAELLFHAASQSEVALCNEIWQRLASDEYRDPRSACLFSRPGATSYCYSASLASGLLLYCRLIDEPIIREIIIEHSTPIEWEVFCNDETQLCVDPKDGPQASLIDSENGLISRSLLDNWIAFQQVPDLRNAAQHEISVEDYQQNSLAIESAWISLFEMIQFANQEPLVRVRPWPAENQAAVSLRYDVDRPTTAHQIRNILRIQRSELNAGCASWYFIPAKPHTDSLREFIERYAQEIAIHHQDEGDFRDGFGVTCHSAPDSQYWRGASTILSAESAGATYAECLSSQRLLPSPALVESETGLRRTLIWTLPIHFPLEGSTHDTTLDYFDRRLGDFHKMIERGGHAIIGSHPDLNQDILSELISRESLSTCWFATTAEVVARCRQLMTVGAVQPVRVDGRLCLVAESSIADVQIEIRKSHCIDRRVIQLVSGKPRRIS